MLARSRARVRFNRKLRVGSLLHVLKNPADQFVKFCWSEKGRRASAQMNFRKRNGPGAIKTAAIEFKFFQNCPDVWQGDVRLLRDALVAAAVGAKRAAERNVNV